MRNILIFGALFLFLFQVHGQSNVERPVLHEVYSLNNLKIMVQDSSMYMDILRGRVNIPAIESGLVSRLTAKGNVIKYPIKIAIDPGHVGTSFKESVLEERFIYSRRHNIKFSEGELTMATAYLLKEMLERHGFVVMITRENYETSFGMSYTQWYKKERKSQLAADLQRGRISQREYNEFVGLGMKDLFHRYFNIADLENRKDKINLFKPDMTFVIHFNASEFKADENTDAPIVDHNYSVSFIPGGFTNDELMASTQSEDLRRLTATDDIIKSLALSKAVLDQFEAAFSVQPLPPDELSIPWVSKYSTLSDFTGVYGRNLYLTRTIQSPLCYVEPFLQNNRSFIVKLNEKTLTVEGRKVSPLLQTVARCYYNAVLEYLRGGQFSIEF